MNKCYVKAYYDWIEQTAALSDAERGRLFIAILEYARSGFDPKLDGRESILFPVFQATIDRDNEKSKTNSQNGALGGRGNKASESEQKPNKASESEQKATKDKRQKTKDIRQKTKEESIAREDAPPTPERRKYGLYGWIRLTDAEYGRLLNDLGEAELTRCIRYIDESAQSNGNKNKWKDWNLVIRKCSRDGWGVDRAKPERSCKTTAGNNAWMKDYLP